MRAQLLRLVSVLILVSLLCPPRLAPCQTERQWDAARQQLVKLIAEGVKDPRVLQSVASTKRHLFVPPDQRRSAYYDMALPIGSGATISPPHIVAFMTEQLDPQPTDKVLEIGTGSGYQAAILSPLVAEVYTIEIIEDLGRAAAERLSRLGYENVHTKVGDGFQGWPEHAPFDKIIVTCSPEDIPTPLVEQLRDGGQMVIPVGQRFQQALCLVTKRGDQLERKVLESTFFIPMTGRAEELREQRADDGLPQLVNGSFEELIDTHVPAGWYYLRQLEIVDGSASPDGNRFLKLENRTPNRAAQALQAFGVDGRRVQEIRISAVVRRKSVRLANRTSHSGIDIRFYDDRRARVGASRIGPWTGSSGWGTKSTRLRVPPNARLAVLAVGLFGATGELLIDKVEVSY